MQQFDKRTARRREGKASEAKLLHVSSELVGLSNAAPLTAQAHFHIMVRDGLIRDVVETPTGLFGRTKGIMYKVPGGRLRGKERVRARRAAA